LWSEKFQIVKRSDKVIQAAAKGTGADPEAIDGKKIILAGAKIEWDAIAAADRRMREVFNSLTKAFGSARYRLIPNREMMEIFKKVGKSKAEYEEKVEAFVQMFPELVEKAKIKMGPELFDPSDYPDQEKLREQFVVDIDVIPLPDGATYSDAVPEAMLKRLQAKTKARTNQHMLNAVSEALTAVKANLAKLSADCRSSAAPIEKGERKTMLYESTFTHVITSGELMGMFNIFEDKRIAKVSKQIAKLGKFTMKDIRKSDEVKENVADVCDSMLKKLNKVDLT
jgi:hypothetical protein